MSSNKKKLLLGLVLLVVILAMPTKVILADDILNCNFDLSDFRGTVNPDKCKTAEGTILTRVGDSNLFKDPNGASYEYSCRSVGETFGYKIVTACSVSKISDSRATELIQESGADCNFVKNGILACVSYQFLRLFAWLLGLVGLLLNKVVQYTVMDAGSTLKNIGIESLWKIVRDLSNIVLIFSLLLIGISTILRSPQYGAKKLLASVIFAALLINFSFAFTRVIIDASNYISYQFYAQLLNNGKTDVPFDSTVGLSGRFMQALKLGTLYQTNNGAQTAEPLLVKNSFLVHMLGAILFLIVAYSFAVAAFHFIGRFVVFIVLMILSPLALLAFFLPFYKSFWNRWWDNLWSNAIMAPAYFLILYFSITLIENMALLKGSKDGYSDLAAVVSGAPPATSITLIMNFGIIIGFILLSLSVAKKIGSEGVGAINATFKAAGKYGGGFLARSSLAGFGTRFGVPQLNERLAKTRTFGGTVLGNTLRKYTVGAVAGAPIAGKSAQQQREALKKEADQRKQVNEALDQKATVQAQIDAYTAAPAGSVDRQHAVLNLNSILQKMSNKERESLGRGILMSEPVARALPVSALKYLTEQSQLSDDVKAKIKESRFATLQTAATRGDLSAIEQELKSVSDEEVDLLGKILESDQVVAAMSKRQFDALMKSNNIGAAQKGAMGDRRKDQQVRRLEELRAGIATPAIAAELDKYVTRLDAEELAALNGRGVGSGAARVVFKLDNDDVAQYLDRNKLRALGQLDSSKFNSAARNAVADKIEDLGTRPGASAVATERARYVSGPARAMFRA